MSKTFQSVCSMTRSLLFTESHSTERMHPFLQILRLNFRDSKAVRESPYNRYCCCSQRKSEAVYRERDMLAN
jgi:hypothetical protein